MMNRINKLVRYSRLQLAQLLHRLLNGCDFVEAVDVVQINAVYIHSLESQFTGSPTGLGRGINGKIVRAVFLDGNLDGELAG
jgi:hypothetical protein